MTAATYLQSGGVDTLIIGNSSGGQMRRSGMLENIPGLGPSTHRGWTVAARMVAQMDKFNVTHMTDIVQTLKPQAGGDGWPLETKSHGWLRGSAVIIATGVYPRQMTWPSEPRIKYMPHLDTVGTIGGQHIAIVGGGNSAAQAALFAVSRGASVTLWHRRKSIKETMSQYMVERITKAPRCIVVNNAALDTAPAGEHVWVYTGLVPRTEWLRDVVYRDGYGYITTKDNGFNANAPTGYVYKSLFAIGDVRAGNPKRCGVAMGEGTAVAAHVAAYLNEARNMDNQA